MAETDVFKGLERLTQLALDDTGGSDVARGLNFHLACAAEGRPFENPVDPRCPPWDLLELRRLDAQFTADALAVIGWSSGLVASWQPLFDSANRILDHSGVTFAAEGRGETVSAGVGDQTREDWQ